MEEEKKTDIVSEQESEKANDDAETTNTAETEKIEADSDKKKSKPINKKFLAILILAVLLVVSYSAYKGGKLNKVLGIKTLSIQEAEAFINENLMEEGSGATVKEVTEENNLWKIKLTVNDQEYTIYLTKDKSTFFPQAISIAEIQQQKADAANQAEEEHAKALADLTKADKPSVELFVMSHCPYGTQAEKGIIPVVKALGEKIDFQLKFCDYAMHDEKELKEELNQYCIIQNQKDKLIPYLECFLADGDGAKCLAQTGIDTNALNTCVAATDSQYKIMANFADQTTWKSGTYPLFPIYQADVDKYKVSGSPTLVVNGTEISTDRDSASLLETVCAGFSNKPEECNQALSSTAPSAGFGYAEGTNTDASCG